MTSRSRHTTPWRRWRPRTRTRVPDLQRRRKRDGDLCVEADGRLAGNRHRVDGRRSSHRARSRRDSISRLDPTEPPGIRRHRFPRSGPSAPSAASASIDPSAQAASSVFTDHRVFMRFYPNGAVERTRSPVLAGEPLMESNSARRQPVCAAGNRPRRFRALRRCRRSPAQITITTPRRWRRIESLIVQPSPTSVASSSKQPRSPESSSAVNCSMVTECCVRGRPRP